MSNNLTPDRRAENVRLREAATPGPWEVAGPFPNVSIGIPDPTTDDPEVGHWGFTPLLRLEQTAELYGDCTLVPDAAYIVAACNDLPLYEAALAEREKIIADVLAIIEPVCPQVDNLNEPLTTSDERALIQAYLLLKGTT